jgi:hypothetical protein
MESIMAVTWDILIISMVHRDATFHELLVALRDQMTNPNVRVLVYRHNLQRPSGEGRQMLLEASDADYVSWVDDDDMVPNDYVAKIYSALSLLPDQVGFRGRFTYDGESRPEFDLSLRYKGHSAPASWFDGSDPRWFDRPGKLLPVGSTYDLMTWACIKREHALAAGFEGDAYRLPDLNTADDVRYCNRLRALDIVKREVYIPEQMYGLRQRSLDTGYTPRSPLSRADIPPRPYYPFVRYLGSEDQ